MVGGIPEFSPLYESLIMNHEDPAMVCGRCKTARDEGPSSVLWEM